MHSFLEFIIFENAHEHVLEHVPEHVFAHEVDFNLSRPLPNKKNFTDPKIYTGNTNLDKRWYVYFSFRNPETGKLQRMKNIYGDANRYTTKSDRLAVLSRYRSRLLKLLRLGFNPFTDNLELFLEMKKKGFENVPLQKAEKLPKKETRRISNPELKEKKVNPESLIERAFQEVLDRKKKRVSDVTIKGYTYSVNQFIAFMKEQFPKTKSVDEINKRMAQKFLNTILETKSSRTYNNARTNLSAVMQDIVDNDLANSNPFLSVKKMKTKPEMHKTYSPEKLEKVFDHLKENDPELLLFIKFVSYGFLRPIEACRLKVGDIDLKNKVVRFKAKNKNHKTQLLPEILLDELPDLSKLNDGNWFFTPNGYGREWEAEETNRRDHFSKRFKYEVKNKLKLGSDFTIYSFRHTFITKLYRELRKNQTPFEAKSYLMQITGHQTMDALNKYLRDIDAELPEDYSDYLKD